ncbi:hypothetical protein J2Z69_003095 [Paenibacillus shirakamiensis]|uniref:Copper amine oxidase-like N-terminal domain-containing protein n=1 Tax=Paenibacillus shirakamiensis TaxID=1265935 RepID=A0ABS4JK23_9BACL|nr:copper amine oxidase N-terminal domain-containing protein [Paenibacillus shirakamiensis]MBP2002038.1 hypothetical protein [Paenibacillus shirakamiensis]
MKRLLTVLTVMILSFTLVLPAQAASKPIQVYMDGTKLTFPSGAPFTQSGTTLVPFRTIFEKLGLSVDWNAKTKVVTGKKSGLTIQLTIGSNRATVNGVIKKLTIAPTTVKGSTYVPLRFVGEASGAEVQWNGATSTINIYSPVNTVQLEKEASTLIHSAVGYLNDRNGPQFLKLLSKKSFISSNEDFDAYLEEYHYKLTIEELSLVSYDRASKTAVVETTEYGTWDKSGAYNPDIRDHNTYTLVREGSVLKLQIIDNEYSDNVISKNTLANKVNVPATEETALLGQLNSYYKALNEEKVEESAALYADADPDFKENLEKFFSDNNFRFTSEKAQIIYYSNNEAAIYNVETTKDLDDKTYQSKDEDITVFKKNAAGTWLISDVYTLYND